MRIACTIAVLVAFAGTACSPELAGRRTSSDARAADSNRANVQAGGGGTKHEPLIGTSPAAAQPPTCELKPEWAIELDGLPKGEFALTDICQSAIGAMAFLTVEGEPPSCKLAPFPGGELSRLTLRSSDGTTAEMLLQNLAAGSAFLAVLGVSSEGAGNRSESISRFEVREVPRAAHHRS